jgi:hypothetical protein
VDAPQSFQEVKKLQERILTLKEKDKVCLIVVSIVVGSNGSLRK